MLQNAVRHPPQIAPPGAPLLQLPTVHAVAARYEALVDELRRARDRLAEIGGEDEDWPLKIGFRRYGEG